MAANKRVVPNFSSEEEAEWWYRKRDMVSRDLKQAAEAGELKVLTRERLRERLQTSANSRNTTIRSRKVIRRELDRRRAKRLPPSMRDLRSLIDAAVAAAVEVRRTPQIGHGAIRNGMPASLVLCNSTWTNPPSTVSPRRSSRGFCTFGGSTSSHLATAAPVNSRIVARACRKRSAYRLR